MKKKLLDMAKTLELFLRENLSKRLPDPLPTKLDHLDDQALQIKTEIETHLLKKYMEEVEKQNKDYFEAKARDLLEMRKHDAVSLATANLLFKSLNINME